MTVRQTGAITILSEFIQSQLGSRVVAFLTEIEEKTLILVEFNFLFCSLFLPSSLSFAIYIYIYILGGFIWLNDISTLFVLNNAK